jgi:hypothetical protein
MTFRIDNRTTIFLVTLVVASATVFVLGSDDRVDAWVAALIALSAGGGGAALPQLVQLVRHAQHESAEQTTRSSDAGSDTEGPKP